MEIGKQPDESGISSEAPRGFEPGLAVRGALRAPGSKSLAQRMLLAAAGAEGVTRIHGVPAGDDVSACAAVVEALGVSVERDEDDLAITGTAPGDGGWHPRGALCVGESGTLARMVTALASFGVASGEAVSIEPSGSLCGRTSAPLFHALRACGVGCDPADATGWPVQLRAVPLPTELRLREPVSSQEVSGLLLACAAAGGQRVFTIEGDVPSRPYVGITCGVLASFGARVEERDGVFLVNGPLRAPAEALAVEPDASSAAVALAAACVSGGEVRATGLGRDSSQGDVRMVEHLRAFGCNAVAEQDHLFAAGLPTRAADVDLVGEPDLAPVLALVAARAALDGHGPSELRGLGTLRGKESDRLAVLAEGLSAAGLRADAQGDRLRVESGDGGTTPLVLDPHGDHRMAFAFALLGLVREGVQVATPGCVAKSWPGFWDDLEGLMR